jgi:hypothetical protein
MRDKIDILNELREAGAVILSTADNRNYFSVPVNYFDQLPESILAHIFIKSLPKRVPYMVPIGYFDKFPGVILDKLKIRENSFLSDIKEARIYAVPEAYFDNLADDILKKVKKSTSDPVQQELEEIAPLLSRIARTNVYSVPENYFAGSNPLNAIHNIRPAAKVIPIGNNGMRKWINYAVAACIVFVLFGGGYFYLSKTDKPDTASASGRMDLDKEISSLTDDEIANYLKDNNNIAVYTNGGTEDYQLQGIDMQNLIQNLSDEEIQQYLNEHPEPNETAGAEGEGI